MERGEFRSEEGREQRVSERYQAGRMANSPHKGGESILRHFGPKQARPSMSFRSLLPVCLAIITMVSDFAISSIIIDVDYCRGTSSRIWPMIHRAILELYAPSTYLGSHPES